MERMKRRKIKSVSSRNLFSLLDNQIQNTIAREVRMMYGDNARFVSSREEDDPWSYMNAILNRQ